MTLRIVVDMNLSQHKWTKPKSSAFALRRQIPYRPWWAFWAKVGQPNVIDARYADHATCNAHTTHDATPGDGDPSVKSNTQAALDYLDHRANTTLLNLLGDTEVGGYAACELVNRKSAVWPQLTDILIHSADPERHAAAVVVFWLSAKSVGLTERDRLLLENVMRDGSSPKVRQASAFALGDSADTFPTSVQSLIDAVNMDTNIAVVAAAAHSLGKLDCTQFGQVSDRLVELLSSHDVAQRRRAVGAMSWFPDQLPSALPTLRSVLARESDEYVKARLARLIDTAATQDPLEPAEVMPNRIV